jgi:hypothetical protein
MFKLDFDHAIIEVESRVIKKKNTRDESFKEALAAYHRGDDREVSGKLLAENYPKMISKRMKLFLWKPASPLLMYLRA